MKVARRAPWLLALGLVTFGAGCGTCRSTEGSVVDAAADTALEASAPSDAGDLPARCTEVTAELELPGGDTFEPGNGVVVGERLFVAGSFAEGGRKGLVVAADLSLGKVEKIDLGELGGGDLAPHLVTAPGLTSPLVAAYAPSPPLGKSAATNGGAAKDTKGRALLLSSLEGGRATLLVKVPQQADESPAFDVLLGAKDAGLVAWDEDSERVVRGVVKVAAFSPGKVAEAVVVTPYETDAESPKLVRTTKGDTFLAWIAREAVLGDAGPFLDADKAGEYLEAPGEERAHQWIEALALDAAGKPRGAPFAVTPRGKGFVAAFELVAAGEGFDVVLVDGAVERDGAGSRLTRVPVRGGKPGTPTLLAHGVAGAASVFGQLVTFVDPSERTMLVSLEGPPRLTREPLAQGGRFVAEISGALVSTQIGAADGGPARAVLRRASCR